MRTWLFCGFRELVFSRLYSTDIVHQNQLHVESVVRVGNDQNNVDKMPPLTSEQLLFEWSKNARTFTNYSVRTIMYRNNSSTN
ncbi:hypothetical protein Y032_0617g698 [Ancylostoma ceylanicum]|uniref:Uncharacterized protein n=1 Tax=Ancylostoma ceylanicum TaxID=53326 RepID=A0A016WMU8_9BILA|nr:hypothetical protein Y032_0617g698 [Ancylostoma ceylanicum]